MRRVRATSIRTRLLVAYIGIIVVGFSGLTVLAGGQVNAAVRSDYQQHLQDEVRIVAQSIGSSINANNLTASGRGSQLVSTAFDSTLKTYESQTGCVFTLYTPGGPPGAGDQSTSSNGLDSNGRPPHDDDPHSPFYSMPELETAQRGETIVVERKSPTGDNTLYTAYSISYNQQIVGLLQLSIPSSVLQGMVVQRWLVLVIGFALLTSLALLAALMLSRSIIQPLYELRESALKLSMGDLSHRVSSTSKDEIGQVARAFNEMADQVQSMLEEQRAFASNTSHELRTPLTAIRLRTEALRNDPTLDEATAREYIGEIDDEIVILGNLVQDLTLLSRFDAGRAELGHAQIDITRLATTLTQQLSPRAAEKHIEFVLSMPSEAVQINASLSHITVVFRNLLDNALKYTPSGTISWTMTEISNGVLNTIKDTGQGIPAQHLPHLYERFFRADKAHSRDIPGTGLGLALVKSIVDAYGGQISITSEGAGKGTIVTVFWPYNPASETMKPDQYQSAALLKPTSPVTRISSDAKPA